MEFVNIYFLALQTIEKFIPKLSAPQIHSLCQRHRRNQWFSRCSHMGTLVTSLYNIAKNNDECAIYMVGIILVANVGILNYKMSHSVISTPKYPNVPIWEHWRHVITLLVGWQIPEMCTFDFAYFLRNNWFKSLLIILTTNVWWRIIIVHSIIICILNTMLEME